LNQPSTARIEDSLRRARKPDTQPRQNPQKSTPLRGDPLDKKHSVRDADR
jgi:hypothetical protein